MTQTPTPAQDLEALARLAGLLMLHTDPQESTIHDLAVLKRALEIESDRHRALRDALVAEWNWDGKDDAGLDRATDRVLRAIASAGAEIHWPSPDSPETPERPSAGDTAPETGGVNAEPTAREKILAEVAATLDGLVIAKELMAYQICDKAAIIAKTAAENDDGTPVMSRANQIEAAAWLLFGALRMDGDR